MAKSRPGNILLAAAFVIYAGLSFYQIDLPGLHYDEAFEAVPALQLLRGQPANTFRGAGLVIGGQTFPLMTQDYIGALNTYAALPFIAALGPTPAALRVMSILVGGITLGLAYLLARRLTGHRWVGVGAALLLAVDPTFVFWNRQGVFVTAITATIGLGAAYCWLRRWQSGLPRWSVAGAFLFGLGIYAKLLFLWLVAALAGAVLLLNFKWLLVHRAKLGQMIKKEVSAGEGIAALLAFGVGCWPLIVYNLQTQGTILSVTQNASTSYYGVNNLAVVDNLAERLYQIVTVLNGGHLWYLGDVNRNFWAPAFFGGVLVLIVYLTTRNHTPLSANSRLRPAPAKVALFPLLVIGLVVLASIATVSALWVTHFAVLMPWPALAITLGCWFILTHLDAFPSRLEIPLKLFIWVGLGVLFATNLFSTGQYHRALRQSGGLSTHSDAVYDMSNWLARHAQGQVVAMDWGLAAPVTYLTGGRVTATEVFGYRWQPDTQLSQRLTNSIQQPSTLYLWRSPDEIIFDRSDEFKALYRPLNLEETIEEAFYEKSGRPILGVTRLVKEGTATNPPK